MCLVGVVDCSIGRSKPELAREPTFETAGKNGLVKSLLHHTSVNPRTRTKHAAQSSLPPKFAQIG